jgi:hypothetical protein
VASALAWLVPLLYLPLRDQAGAALAPGTLRSMRGLFEHATGYGFRGDALYFTDLGSLVDRALVITNIALLQFGPLLLGLAAVGAVWLLLARPHRKSGTMLVGTAAIVTLLALTYRAPQTMEYLVPAYVAVAVLVGATGGLVLRAAGQVDWNVYRPAGESVEHPERIATNAVILGAVAVLFIVRGSLPANVAAARQPMDEVVHALDRKCTADGGSVLASWHFVTPLWYTAAHIQPRPDLDIEYVYPEGAEPIGETWRRRLEESTSPTTVTNRSQEMIAAQQLIRPLPGTPFYSTEGTGCVREGDRQAVGATFGELVVLDAAYVSARRFDPDPLIAVFRPLRPVHEPLTVFAQLVESVSGDVFGQVDRTIGPELWNAPGGTWVRLPIVPFRGDLVGGEGRSTRSSSGETEGGGGSGSIGLLGIPEGYGPQDMQLVVGVYRQTPDGPQRLGPAVDEHARDQTAAAPTIRDDGTVVVKDSTPRVEVQGDTLPASFVGELMEIVRHNLGAETSQVPAAQATNGPEVIPGVIDFGVLPDGAIPFGRAMWLVGSSVDRVAAGSRGGSSTDGHGVGDDLVVDLTWLAERAFESDYTVSVQVRGEGWSAQHDGIPATGAIPTLKWLPGMRISDRHRVQLPPDLPPDAPFTVTVAVYDAFSLEPLPVARRDLAEAGQGQAVVIHETPTG